MERDGSMTTTKNDAQNHHATFNDIPEQAARWLNEGHKVALATVVQTWGSSPRPVGSQLAVNESGAFVGSVSGGCIEGAVVTEALDIMESGRPSLLEFGVDDSMAWEVGLACGGTVKVYVEALNADDRQILDNLLEKRRTTKPATLVTDVTSGQQCLISNDEKSGPLDPPAEITAFCADVLRQDKSRLVELGDQQFFLQAHNPPLRLFIIGAVHISQALAPIASLAGYEVNLVDPRQAWATEERFPAIHIDKRWPDDALEGQSLNSRTAVVTLTHDPKLDDPALEKALRSDVFYIGALGSKKTHAKRVARLQDAGFTEDEINRIDAPVGLDIGAVSPAEIAVAIMGQITLSLRGPKHANG